MSKINEILAERRETHGSFYNNSRLSQEFKRVFAVHSEGKSFSPEMREAMDMIFHKISRIAVGNAYEVDHWQDIAGYAQLVVNSLEAEVEESPIKHYEGAGPEITYSQPIPKYND